MDALKHRQVWPWRHWGVAALAMVAAAAVGQPATFGSAVSRDLAAQAASVSAPQVQSIDPFEGAQVEEDQHWLLHLNGPVVADTVRRNAWCEVQGVGERVPVIWVDGAPRAALLKSQHIKDKDAERVAVLTCQRPLPPAAGVKLVWGPGIAAANNPKIVTREPRRFAWEVRERFTAEFTCERERAEAPCIPLRPMQVRFSAPVAREVAAQIRLTRADGQGSAVAPKFARDATEATAEVIDFPAPLDENTRYQVTLPKDFRDASGRALANASAFPLQTATGGMPPLAKFAAAPFGVVELGTAAEPGMLPITVRRVHEGGGPPPKARLNVKTLDAGVSDKDLLQWFAKVQRHHETSFTAKELGWPRKDWTVTETVTDDNGQPRKVTRDRMVGSRELSLLAKEGDVQRSDLPGPGTDTAKTPGATEVLGLPLTRSGYHVVEISSRVLGRQLLDREAPMYVRAGVLVTPMGVHFKRGRTSSLVWVTTLDRAQPVANADVAVNDCRGDVLWSGRTDAQGVARIPRGFEVTYDQCLSEQGLFITARSPTRADGGRDLSFVFSGWSQGIESWRFNHPTASGPLDDRNAVRAHTVFDRTLLRVGETVSMKHWLRLETERGLAAFKAEQQPDAVDITHVATGEVVTLPYARAMRWAIPQGAKQGFYEVTLKRKGGEQGGAQWSSGQFRVEAFKVPLVDARLSAPAGPQVAPRELSLGVQLTHLSGGGLATAASLNALLRPAYVHFPDYDDYSFSPPDTRNAETGESVSRVHEQVIADRQPVKTDAQGAATAKVVLPASVQALKVPAELVTEVSFDDPNGERQTVGRTTMLWPSSLVVGIRARSWLAQKGRVPVQMVVLDTAGKPQAGQAVTLRGEQRTSLTTRQKVVGGFYAYDSKEQVSDLGTLCSGKTDARGLLVCDLDVTRSGEIHLIAQASDGAGKRTESSASVWVSLGGELWFEQDNDDRIDLLPEQRDLKPGDTARLQVRMPFREATVLVTVEREGVLDAKVVTLRGSDPVIEVPIPKASTAGASSWAPNVYVSALVLRGRIRHVPWYSFFDWGWRAPTLWWNAWRHEGPAYQAPTAMVDLAKPAFKLGVAALRIGLDDHRLEVKVTPAQPQYGVRQTAKAAVQVLRGGQPLAGGEVAFAAVDEGLLALMPNTSWELLEAMFQPRAWGVETATAQNEIIGRRHYGRKALAPGGSGGRNPTRELFDTLLLWQPAVKLDAQGRATIDVPLNDALTSFRLVAIADGGASGADQFGTGSASIRVSQDLQMLAGLPTLVREGDQFEALYTLRNTTARAMKVRATLTGQPAQEVSIAAGAATEVRWTVTVPTGVTSLTWEGSAEEVGVVAGGQPARDRIKVVQQVQPVVPVRVQQATIRPLDGTVSWPVAPPVDALPGQGGVQVTLKPTLAGALPGIRRYFEQYPYRCLEQKTSRAIGLHDTAAWTALVGELPTYLDRDGLAHYFPPSSDSAGGGSDALTAYVLAASQAAGWTIPDAPREAMLAGLTAFVEGRLERRLPSPRGDALERDVRKLAAIEALSRHGRATARLLGSLEITPQQWPTGALIDWLAILRRVEGIPQRAQRIDEARGLLRARLVAGGTMMKFADEAGDAWWWLMTGADANAARLLLTAVDDGAGWRDDLPRLVTGLMARLDAQRSGAFSTTTANVWTTLALERFSAVHESTPVTGRSRAVLGATTRELDWAKQAGGGVMSLPWAAPSSPPATSATPATLTVTQQGTGQPWIVLQSLAAVPLQQPFSAGYRIERSVTGVEQKTAGRWTRGDVLRVQLKVTAMADLGWVVISDPVPPGAALLGNGLGRDAQIATRGEQSSGTAWRVYEERLPEAWRAYYAWLPRGTHTVEYTVRLNTAGRYTLPPSRVEAMYAPENFGEAPVGVLEVR
ncbi:alpha-2-macroglobulin family protein [Sphaerotilus sp.]|uniref:alpha-2-macroglobulin family protein n=1 Tax=Sphaerotilus sp. TaxID=2093942 RepID=UPI002ACF092A|nr:alpha-2-macroglobulin family protein [Sphaerotilus sp.]MDZ7857330.1 MG2 domain-containing protein [Sphaerotilus sp.]